MTAPTLAVAAAPAPAARLALLACLLSASVVPARNEPVTAGTGLDAAGDVNVTEQPELFEISVDSGYITGQ